MKIGKILNLVNSEASDIQYQVSRFFDGQQNIVILTKGIYSNPEFVKQLNVF